jgi:hypothetical protein
MSKKDPNIIRIDDEIRVKKPNFFIRCGYPLSLKEACKIIKEKCHKEINEFINKFNFNPLYYSLSLLDNNEYQDTKTFREITSTLAYDYMRSKNFGGSERQIYTEEFPQYKNKLMIVDNIKFVKTGIYVPGSHYIPYESEEDPAHLINVKTHKLIHVYLNESILSFKKDKHEFTVKTCSDWIEITNVEKIQKD